MTRILLLLMLQGGQPDGAAVYQKHCAVCHDPAAAAQTRSPDRENLKKLTPEGILRSLVSGTMKAQGAELSSAERRAVSEFLAGRKFRFDPSAIDKAAAAPAPASEPAKTPEVREPGACPSRPADFRDPLAGPRWNGWGVDASNTRFQPAAMAGLTAEQVPRLKLKWAFGFAGVNSVQAQPTVAGGRIFAGSMSGAVYALDAATGCTIWTYKPEGGVRTAISIGALEGGKRHAAYFADYKANVYAVDAAGGELVWKTRVEEHPWGRLTGAPLLHDGRLYVPVSSHEEVPAGSSKYECCRFRGSVAALDAQTGRQIWKTYTIAKEAQPTKKTEAGTQLWGPSGAAVWATPTYDPVRKMLYVVTGNSYSDPVAETSDAVMALDAATGRVVWSRQVTPGDGWNFACIGKDKSTCPEAAGPDHDFGHAPILRSLPGGKRVLLAGQKSGVMYALDPDREGEKVWEVRLGQGSALGGIQWGPAADDRVVYVALSDVLRENPGGLFALRIADGEKVWHAPPAKAACAAGQRGCSPAQSAAVTLIPGVVFSGSIDGHIRAYSTKDGAILWDFNTIQDYTTVNQVPAKGGSLDGPGPTVAGGMLFVNSGYGAFRGAPGNVLLAFSPDGK